MGNEEGRQVGCGEYGRCQVMEYLDKSRNCRGGFCHGLEESIAPQWRRLLGIPTRRAENSEEELRRRNWERRSLGKWIVPEV